ncbi:hypothetical protein J3P75_16070 [Pseudomonas sp. R1-1]|uniref:hypothetical protein n=1 Tax=Pseudomonas sp. R1-1 TaxID=1602529 RepID=UPI003DA9ECD0
MENKESKAGSLDPSFGVNGEFTFQGVDHIFALMVDRQDRIYAAGRTEDNRFYVDRLTSEGKVDTTFGDAGRVSGLFGDASQSQALTINVDLKDRVLITGNQFRDDGAVCLARFTPQGNPDTSFSLDGQVVMSLSIRPERSTATDSEPDSVGSSSNACRVLSDGKILFYGRAGHNYGPYLVRFTDTGQLDSSFNDIGYTKVSYKEEEISPRSLSIIQGERIIVSGHISGDAGYGMLAAYNQNGKLEHSFATQGYALFQGPDYLHAEVMDMQQGPGSQLWVTGGTANGAVKEGFLTRLDKDGHVDTTFNHGNPVLSPPGFIFRWEAMAIQEDGKIVLAGWDYDRRLGRLGRYYPGGPLDTDFGEGGLSTFPSEGSARQIALQSNGRILAGGNVTRDGYRVPAILRFLP